MHQSVDRQKNDADVDQYQGNGNINVAPAIAVFGDAKTTNRQGSANTAVAVVDQKNSVDQSQSSFQKQSLEQSGEACCIRSSHGKSRHDCCESGPSQAGEQTSSFGDQSVGKQRNDADVTQKQGNGNVNVAPAISVGGKKGYPCEWKCESPSESAGGGAATTNSQGNGNTAVAWVGQSNSVDQSQAAFQWQDVVDQCKALVTN